MVTLTANDDGSVDAQLRVCAAIPAPQLFTNSWYTGADIGHNCQIQLGVLDGTYGQPARSADVHVACTTAGTNVLGQPQISSSTRYTTDLPASAWVVDGQAISIHASKAILSAAQAGHAWANPYAGTYDGARLTEESDQYQRVNEPGPGTRPQRTACSPRAEFRVRAVRSPAPEPVERHDEPEPAAHRRVHVGGERLGGAGRRHRRRNRPLQTFAPDADEPE